MFKLGEHLCSLKFLTGTYNRLTLEFEGSECALLRQEASFHPRSSQHTHERITNMQSILTSVKR